MKKYRFRLSAAMFAASMAVAPGLTAGAASASPDVASQSIVIAAREGDDEAVRALLKKRVAVDMAQVDGTTALMWAAYRSDVQLLRVLIAAGADVNAKNRYEMTPLLLAARVGNADMITALLKAGADPKKAERRGETPLLAAAMAGSNDSVKALIKRGSDVNAREQDRGQTALMWAAARGHADVVGTLLAAGADPNVVATASTLVNEPKVGARVYVNYARGGLTALMFAAREGHIDVARSLVAAGAELNVKNASGLSPMLIAVINDWRDLAAMLLDAGADPNDGSLYEAIRFRNLRVDTTASDASRPWPFNRNEISPVQLVERLLDKGADANAIPSYTLHSEGVGAPQPVTDSAYVGALRYQDVEVLRILLDRKAVQPNALLPGPTPATPLMAICTVIAPLGALNGAGSGPFRYPAGRNPDAAARLLIESGADVNEATPKGETAVHRAAQQGRLDVLKVLASNGARLDMKDENGLTPLDLAMGKKPPSAAGDLADEGPRGSRPQPEAAALLRELMKLAEDKKSAADTPALSSNLVPRGPAGN